jgi:signal transduction histidine kinase
MSAIGAVSAASYLGLTGSPTVYSAAFVAAWILVVAAAGLRRWPVWTRVALLMVTEYMNVAVALDYRGTWMNFRLPLAVSPVIVLVLVGARSGLAVTAINFGVLVAGFAATDAGWLTQAPLPWQGNDLAIQTTVAVAEIVPKLVLIAWFNRYLIGAVRREKATATRLAEVSASLRREAAERERLQGEVLDAGERERQMIGLDLHDGVCQDLAGVMLKAKALEMAVDGRAMPEADTARSLVRELGQAIGDVHGLSRRLGPGHIESGDLPAALVELARGFGEAGLAVSVRTSGRGNRVEGAVATQLYRVAQEALANAARHSGATRVEVALDCDPEATVLRVEDDGCGVGAAPARKGGLGLRSMAWRAEVLGGKVDVSGRPGGGTRVECRIPVAGAQGGEDG